MATEVGDTFHNLRRMRIAKLRRLTKKKLRKFVADNPGMTAAMIAHCLHRKWGTVSSMLSKICKEPRLFRMTRVQMRGMRGGKAKAWRYYATQDISV